MEADPTNRVLGFQVRVQRHGDDSESVYHTWFLDEERLKAFHTIRRDIQVVAEDIFMGRFPRFWG